MKESVSKIRRMLLGASVGGAAAGLLAGLLPADRSRAADLPPLSEDDPTAQSLKYAEDATQSARPSEDQFCHNCQYFQAAHDAERGPCAIFPGKSVSGTGWCSAWTMKS